MAWKQVLLVGYFDIARQHNGSANTSRLLMILTTTYDEFQIDRSKRMWSYKTLISHALNTKMKT
jgi:hypothetical protein